MFQAIVEILFNKVLTKPPVKVSDSLSSMDVLKYIFNKGGFSLVRGTFARLFCKKVNGLFFLGKSTRLLHANKISMGKNCFIGDFGYINALSKDGVNLGNNVTIREYCWLQLTSSLGNPGMGIDVGDNTYIGPRVNLGAAAPVIIGERCQIGASVSFIAENHEYKTGKEIYNQGVTRKGIMVGNDCWIGNQVVILDGVTIGDGAVIGAGSVVTKHVPSGAVVVGNPARVLKMRNNDE